MSNPPHSSSETDELGDVLAEHKTTIRWIWLVIGVLILCAAAITGFVALSRGRWQDGPAAFFDGGIFAAPFLLLAFLAKPHRASIQEHGIHLKKGSRQFRLRWDEITGLKEAVTRHSINFIPVFTTHRYTVLDVSGKKHVFTDTWTKVEHLFEAVFRATFPHIMQRAVETMGRGEAFSFGPLAVSPTELVHGKRRYSWDEVAHVEVASGQVNIKKHKTMFASSSLRVPDIKNFRVFLEIVARLGKLRA